MAERGYCSRSCAGSRPCSGSPGGACAVAAAAGTDTYHIIVTFADFVKTARTAGADSKAGQQGPIAAVGSTPASVAFEVAADAAG